MSDDVDDSSSLSFTLESWQKLRSLCKVLQQTQITVVELKAQIEYQLTSSEKTRDKEALIQMTKISIQILADRVEQRRRRLLTGKARLAQIGLMREQRFSELKSFEDSLKVQKDEINELKSTHFASRERLAQTFLQISSRRRHLLFSLTQIYPISFMPNPGVKKGPKFLKGEMREKIGSVSSARIIDMSGRSIGSTSNLTGSLTDLNQLQLRTSIQTRKSKPCQCKNLALINGVHLPHGENLSGHDDISLSCALGFLAHYIQVIANISDCPLRYPLELGASRSWIFDYLSPKLYDEDRKCPLFPRGSNHPGRNSFEYAVYLLNKTVAQLRWDLARMGTDDLRIGVENLAELMERVLFRGRAVGGGGIPNPTPIPVTPKAPPSVAETSSIDTSDSPAHSVRSQPIQQPGPSTISYCNDLKII